MKQNTSEADFYKDYTLIEALAELYNFNPKKKAKSQIIFEIIDENNGGCDYLRFGKTYSSIEHKWEFMENAKNGPWLNCEEKHFISNLMCNHFAKDNMIYGAQQGTFKVHKVYDSRIDDNWHFCGVLFVGGETK